MMEFFKNNDMHLRGDVRKMKKLVEGENFNVFILSCICTDAILLGMMTSRVLSFYFQPGLFILDRLFMGIFILEMLLKLWVYRGSFFKSGWNVFDFIVVAVSSVPMTSAFIILRAFRLFRLFKYIGRSSTLKDIMTSFFALLPAFVSMLTISAIFFYVFAIMGYYMYGGVFMAFASLPTALFSLFQVFTLDGWSVDIVRPIMSIFPCAWVYFVSFLMFSFLIVVSFLVTCLTLVRKVTK